MEGCTTWNKLFCTFSLSVSCFGNYFKILSFITVSWWASSLTKLENTSLHLHRYFPFVFLPLSFFLQKAAWGSLLLALHGSQGEGLTSGGWEDFIVVIRWHCIYSPLGRLASFAHRTILRISGAYQIVFRRGSVALSVLDHLGHTPQRPRKVIFTTASSTGLHTEKQASE